MKTIVYVLHKTSPDDGSTKAFVNLLNGVMPLGIHPIVVLPDKKGICKTLKEKGIEVFVTPYRHNTYPHYNTLKNAALFFPRIIVRRVVNAVAVMRLVHYLRNKDIDIIHTNVSINAIGIKSARKLNLPHVYHLREYSDMLGYHYYPSKRAFNAQLALSKSFSICITRGIQQYYAQTNNSRSRVIYDGVLGELPPLQAQPVDTYFFYAGRIEKEKGVDMLLEGYCQYAHEAKVVLPLQLAGSITSPAYYQNILDYIREHNVTSLVTFLGQRNDVPQLMRDAIATIIPSQYEGFGFTMVEAMGQGCLTIGRDAAGLKEQMDNGTCLYGSDIALRFTTKEQLAKHLQDIAEQDPHVFAPMRERAHHAVSELYTIEQNAHNVFDFYMDILS